MATSLAILLGFVQGITEFLPVSSTGHLVLLHAVLDNFETHGLAFDAILHLATAGAVIVYFFDDIHRITQSVLRMLGRLPVHEKELVMAKALMLGTIPAIILGLLLEDLMATLFRHPLFVALILILGSVFFMFAEHRYDNCYHDRTMTPKIGFLIGCFQTLALFPGFSRSGATLAGGMLLGLSRGEAARFAFLLSVPILLGAGTKKLIELLVSDISVAWAPILFGAITAFGVGLLAIHFMISYVRQHTLWPFIWYRIILAGFIVFVVVFNS
jgi:undecaprenyl-diphosphatase